MKREESIFKPFARILPAVLLLLAGVSACTPVIPPAVPNISLGASRKPPVTLSIVPEDALYKPGETVNATLFITNVSASPVSVFPPAARVTPQDNSSQVLFTQPAGSKVLSIKPGENVSFNFTWDQADAARRQVERGWYRITFGEIEVRQVNAAYFTNPSTYVLLEYSPIQDDKTLRPYIHFFRLVAAGTPVSPELVDLPMPPVPVSYDFSRSENLEIVFIMGSVPASGTVLVRENNRDSKAVVLTQNWSFTASTGNTWSNLMRPPGVTLWENHLPLGSFPPGAYVLTITIENRLTQSIGFKVY